jgi:hypothetical protein
VLCHQGSYEEFEEMIFDIYNTCQSSKTRLIEDYPVLSKFGYHDERLPEYGFGYKGKVVINSLEELLSLGKAVNQYLIIQSEPLMCTASIEIYDGYRE